MLKPPDEEMNAAKVCAECHAWVPLECDEKFLSGRPVLHLAIGGRTKLYGSSGGVLRTMTRTGAFYLDAMSAVYIPLDTSKPALALERYAPSAFAVGFTTHTDAMDWFAKGEFEREWASIEGGSGEWSS